jgi:hypothetical protein
MKSRLVVLLLTLALVAGACGGSGSTDPGGSGSTATGGPRPTSTGTLEIASPKNGASVTDPVTLRVKLQGAKLVPTTTTDVVPDEGHLHVSLDGTLISMTSGLEQELPTLAPGTHILQVEFVASDHAPFDPRVIASASFEVAK